MTAVGSTAALGDLSVFATDGRATRVASLWSGRSAVLLFVRHFGCIFCRQQVAEMLPHLDRIRALGGELFVIGNGSVEEAREFAVEHAERFPVFTDPSKATYCELGMKRGLGTVLRPSVVARGLRAMRKGFHQSRVAGDPWQQGGVVVIDAAGRERFRFVSRTAGEHPAPGEVVAALQSTMRT